MVAILVIPDGAAEPVGAGPTTLALARTPVLDALAREGDVARVAVTPASAPPGSETGIPALLGWTPPTPIGRGWVDAAAYGIDVPEGWTPVRADVLDGGGARATAAEAHSAARSLGPRAVHTAGHRLLLLAPPGQRCDFVPLGGKNSHLCLRIWEDGPPPPPVLGGETVVVCGPGAAAGCARLLGADVVVPETATGDVDTDLAAKARAARAAIARGATRVVVHVGGPDEAAHRQDAHAKRAALEAIDAVLLGPLRDAVAAAGGTLAVCPDHGTDPRTGAHDPSPVPAVRWSASHRPAGVRRLTEVAAAQRPVHPPTWPLGRVEVPA